ncbi:MAG: LysR family transcriptional regulator [Pseudomonadales bacterium]|jgi:DNA-binding transcriptional LysR family regulator|tara:strand:+ start:2363 stop:3268 length:906 start_codon:yes stop_codon:yes gene_type:complete
MLKVTLKQLHYFVTVAEHQSISAAARSLHISQPAITHAMGLLEDHFQLQLFLRHHAQGVSLTTSGQDLLVRASSLLAHAHELETNVKELGQGLYGRLEIGCFFTLAPMYMPPLITQFLQLHPQVDVRLYEANQDELNEGLHTGQFDLAFMYTLALGPDLAAEVLAEPMPHILLDPNHELAHQDSISLTELVDLPMVLLDVAPSRDYFTSLFRNQGLEPWIRYRSPSFETVRGLVGHGMGYSVLVTQPMANVDYNGNTLCLRPIKEEVEPGYISMTWLEAKRPTRLMQTFQEFAKQHFSATQ